MKKLFLLPIVGLMLLSCSENVEDSTSLDQSENVSENDMLSAYRTAFNQYAYKKDNPMFDQSEVNDLIVTEAKQLLETYGEPKDFHEDPELTENENLINKSFERYSELTLIKKLH